MDLTGLSLGGYQLTHKLGQGGFAHVYLGERDEEQVAVKVIPNGDIDEFHLMRALQAYVSHTVSVYGYGEVQIDGENVLYIVMRYYSAGALSGLYGNPLRDYLFLSRVAEDVSSVLQLLHDYNLVHADVKPDNILMDEEGGVVLSDYGLVSEPGEEPFIIKGSLAYMPPEQIRGTISPQGDQYSLAVSLAELLLGVGVFSINAKELKHTISSGVKIENPREEAFYWTHMFHLPSFPEDIPDCVALVLLRAMHNDPEYRYATISEFAEEFSIACMKAYRLQLDMAFEPAA